MSKIHPKYGVMEHSSYNDIAECFDSYKNHEDEEEKEEFNRRKENIESSVNQLLEDLSYTSSIVFKSLPNLLLSKSKEELIKLVYTIEDKKLEYVWEDCFGEFYPFGTIYSLTKEELVYYILNIENHIGRIISRDDYNSGSEEFVSLRRQLEDISKILGDMNYEDEVRKSNKIIVTDDITDNTLQPIDDAVITSNLPH